MYISNANFIVETVLLVLLLDPVAPANAMRPTEYSLYTYLLLLLLGLQDDGKIPKETNGFHRALPE